MRAARGGRFDHQQRTLILGILLAVAEFVTDIRKERQRESLKRGKAAGI